MLVTGGSGFIGTNLMEDLLSGGISVVNLDHRPPLDESQTPYWREVDIMDQKELLRAFQSVQPTHVVHLAARTDLSEKSNISGYGANIGGVENLLNAINATASIRRVLIASSMLVCRLGHVPTHSLDYQPDTLYGESKVLTEKITAAGKLSCTWSIVRPTTIWGPWHMRLVKEFFKTIERGYYFHPGRKDCLRTYGFVGNTVHQIRRLLDAPAEQVNGNIFYLGDPPIRLRDFANGFSQILRGRNAMTLPYLLLRAAALFGDATAALGFTSFPLTSRRLGNMTTDNVIDLTPTFAVTGPPKYTLEQGIEMTVQRLPQMKQATARWMKLHIEQKK